MNEFKLYTEEYYTARRLANILYRPAMASDNATIVSKELWESGIPIVVERNDGRHEIYRR